MLEEIIAALNDITGADAGEITPESSPERPQMPR